MWEWVLKTAAIIEEWFGNEVNVQIFYTVLSAAFLWFILCSLILNWRLVEVNGVWYGMRGKCEEREGE